MHSFFQPSIVDVVIIPPIPTRLTFDKLSPDLKALPDNEREQLKKLISESSGDQIYYTKTQTGLSYDVIYQNNQIWVVGGVVASGSHGSVSNIQDDKTGEFCICKNSQEPMIEEHNILEQLSLAKGPLLQQFVKSPVVKIEKDQKQSPTSSPLQKIRKKAQDIMQLESSFIMELAPGISAETAFYKEFDKEFQAFQTSYFPPALRMQLLISLVDELSKLHQKNIIHRDLALGNVMIDWAEQRVRFIDFGLAKKLDNKSTVYMDTLKGSSLTYPPEFRAEFHRICNEKKQGNLYPSLEKLEYSELTDVAEASVLLAAMSQLIEFPDMQNPSSWGDKNFIVGKDHPLCQNSICFPKEVAEALVDLLHGLFDKDLSNRAQTWKNAKTQLENIRDTYLPDEKLKVAVIDFNQFKQADFDSRSKLIRQFYTDEISEVWLIDSDPKSNTLKEYAELHNDFLRYELIVGRKIYTGPCDEARAALQADLNKRPVQSKLIAFDMSSPTPSIAP